MSPISYSLNLLNTSLLPNNKIIIESLYQFNGVVSGVDLSNQIDIVRNYNYSGIFDVSNTFKLLDWSTVNVDGKLLLSKIKIVDIYLSWQSILNLTMPWVFSSLFCAISIYKFKWVVR